MHELPVTEEIVRLACQTAKEQGGRVTAMELVVGRDSGFIGESIQMYFDVISQGTACDGAKLTIIPVQPMLRCEDCGQLFQRRPFHFDCPRCGGNGVPTEIGKEFYIKSVELENEAGS